MKSNKLGLLTTKIGSGITPRGGQSVYQNLGTHLIRSQNIYNHKFEKNGLVCISQEIAEKMKSVEIMNDDVLINITGDSVARVYLVPDEILPARVNQHVCILRTKPELNPHYLYYFLINPTTQNHLLSIAGIGGTRNALTKEMLYNLIIEYPDLPTQEKIVKQLNTIKNKIITLENQNHILEETAQTIFKSWFVDFDGVTEFEDSELGKIPKGWMVESIGFLFTITDYTANGSFAGLRENVTYSYVPDYAILIRQLDHNRNWNGDYVYVDKHSYDFLKKSSLVPGDVMISNIGNVGTVFRVPDLGKPMTGAPNILVVKTVDSKKEFIYNLLRNPIGQNAIFSITTGSAQPKFNKTDFRNLKIISPAENIIKQFHDVSYPLRRKIEINSFKIQSLTKTRDTLLPKLMSGEIRV